MVNRIDTERSSTPGIWPSGDPMRDEGFDDLVQVSLNSHLNETSSLTPLPSHQRLADHKNRRKIDRENDTMNLKKKRQMWKKLMDFKKKRRS